MRIFKPAYKIFLFCLGLSLFFHTAIWFFASASGKTKQNAENDSSPRALVKQGIVSVDLVATPAAITTSKTAASKTPVSAPTNSQAEQGAQVPAGLIGEMHPEYPRLSRENGEQGTSLLAFTVDQNGNVLEPRIIQTSGYERLDQAALAAIRVSKFLPAQRSGKATSTETQLRVRFQLDSK